MCVVTECWMACFRLFSERVLDGATFHFRAPLGVLTQHSMLKKVAIVAFCVRAFSLCECAQIPPGTGQGEQTMKNELKI